MLTLYSICVNVIIINRDVMQVQEKILELLYTINEDVVSIKMIMEVKQEINVLKEDMSK